MKRLKTYPTPIAGLTLALLSSLVFWSGIFQHQKPLILTSTVILGLLFLLPLLIKFITHQKLLWEELKHPTTGSTVPTFAMATMFLSKAIGVYSIKVAIGLWLFAFSIHGLFFMIFLFHQTRTFHIHKMIPGWFVPPIGIVAACLTVPTPAFLLMAKTALFFGIGCYFILMPIMLYRFFLHDNLDDNRKPSLAIFAAPPSLCLAGYLTLIQHQNPLLILLLFSIAMLMTTTVYLMLFHLIRLNFTPAFSSYTFPLVISGTAMYKTAHWMQTTLLFSSYHSIFLAVAFVEATLASLMVLYVLFHYIFHLRTLFSKQ